MDTLKNEDYKFNLITEKWIKVLTKKGNDFYSLLEVFENAEDILSLENENKYIDYSIYRILLAIFLTAYNRNEETKLKNYSKKEQGRDEDADFEYRLDIIKDYLLNQEDEQGVKIYDLFDIYDKDRPFLQMTPERHKNSSVKKVWDEIVEENSASKNGQKFKPFNGQYSVLGEKPNDIQKLALTFQDASELSRIQSISDDWIARNLINYYYFHSSKNDSGPRIEAQDVDMESVLFFGKNLIDFFRLQYQMSLNSKNKLYPVWEINTETEFNQNNTEYLIDKKNQKIKYYNSLLNNDVIDLPRLLTYSNIILYIDRENNKFYRVPNLKNNIMINEKEYKIGYLNKLQYIKSQEKKERINNIKSFLNIDERDYRYISTLKFPKYKGSFKTCVEEVFNEEIILGNNIVNVDSIKEEYENLEEDVTLERRKEIEIQKWFDVLEEILKIKKRLKDKLSDNCKDEIRILLNYKENEPYNKSRKKNLEEKYEKRRREYINNIDNVVKDKIYSFCLSYIYEYDLREIKKRYGKDEKNLEEYIKNLCYMTEQEFNRRYLKNRSYGIAGLLKNKKQEKNQ